MSSYTQNDAEITGEHGRYEPGNFIISFGECDTAERSCRDEMRPWLEKLHGIEI